MPESKGILTRIQRTFIERFANLPDQRQFYLAGGTALAEYYLGHRLSFDLDFFTAQDALVLPFSYRVEALTGDDLQVRPVRRFASYVEFLVTQGDSQLKVELAQDSPYRFAVPEEVEPGILVNDFEDLQVDKLLAYYGRAEPRDAVDLHFILKHTPIEHLLELAPQKDPGFDPYWFAVALNRAEALPDEAGRWPVQMLEPLEPASLKRQFRELARSIANGLPPRAADQAR